MCSELNSTFIIIGANIYNQKFLEIHENHEKLSNAQISTYHNRVLFHWRYPKIITIQVFDSLHLLERPRKSKTPTLRLQNSKITGSDPKSRKKIWAPDLKHQNNPSYILKVSILNSQPFKIDSRTVRVLTIVYRVLVFRYKNELWTINWDKGFITREGPGTA